MSTKPVRLAGHAATYDYGNGVCVKPKCRCGWVGYAQPMNGARSQYRNHLLTLVHREEKARQSAA